MNSERVNYVDSPISTNAVLLFKGRYQHSINLFPFLIDINALTDEAGAKVCFYNHQDDIGDGSLSYQFMEDNSFEHISYQQVCKDDADMNRVMMDAKQRRAYHLDSVFLQFQAARKALLQTEDDLDFLSDESDDFDFN